MAHKLSPSEFKMLREALLFAFPDRVSLKQMIRFGLNKNLDHIAGGLNQTDLVFNLIEWAEAHGRINDLIDAAIKDNPGNPYLSSLSTTGESFEKHDDQLIEWDDPSYIETDVIGDQDGLFENVRRKLHIFLCHSHDDKKEVQNLYKSLQSAYTKPWLDTEDLVGGQKWEVEIPKVVQDTDIVLVCLSRFSVNWRGYILKEIRFALDAAATQKQDANFLIPVRLEDCKVPESLEQYHWINLFEDDGWNKLILALQRRAESLTVKHPVSTAPYAYSDSKYSKTASIRAFRRGLLSWQGASFVSTIIVLGSLFAFVADSTTIITNISKIFETVSPTAISVPPTATSVPPTATSVPPTATSVPPTATSVPPTATSVPPTATSVLPTATSVPPTATSVPPTATSVPPTAISVPPTATSVPPTATSVSPTATPTLSLGEIRNINEDFNNNLQADWQIEKGDWRALQNRFEVIQYEDNLAWISVGSSDLTNYSIRLKAGSFAKISGLGDIFGPIDLDEKHKWLVVILHQQDNGDGIYFSFNAFRFGCSVRKNGELENIEEGPQLSVSGEFMVRAEVRENAYIFTLNDQRVCVIGDKTFDNGNVGIIGVDGNGNQTWIDDFTLTVLD